MKTFGNSEQYFQLIFLRNFLHGPIISTNMIGLLLDQMFLETSKVLKEPF